MEVGEVVVQVQLGLLGEVVVFHVDDECNTEHVLEHHEHKQEVQRV